MRTLVFYLAALAAVALTQSGSSSVVPVKPLCNTGNVGPRQAGGADRFPEKPVQFAGDRLITVACPTNASFAHNTEVVAFYPMNCSVAWTYTAGIPVSSSGHLGSTGDVVAVVVNSPQGPLLAALNATSGSEIWKEIEQAGFPAVTVADGFVAYTTGSTLTVRGAATGATQFTKSFNSTFPPTATVLRYSAGLLLVGEADSHQLVALNSEGDVVWNITQTLSDLQVMVKDFGGSQHQDIVVITGQHDITEAAILLGMNATTGEKIWMTNVQPSNDVLSGPPSFGQVHTLDDVFFVILGTAGSSYSTTTGVQIWREMEETFTVHTTPTDWDGATLVVYGSPTSNLVGLDRQTGAVSWQTPVFGEGTVLAGSAPVSFRYSSGRGSSVADDEYLAVLGYGYNGGPGSLTVFAKRAAKSQIVLQSCGDYACREGCRNYTYKVGQCFNETSVSKQELLSFPHHHHRTIPTKQHHLDTLKHSSAQLTTSSSSPTIPLSIMTRCISPAELEVISFEGSSSCDTTTPGVEIFTTRYKKDQCIVGNDGGSQKLLQC